MLINKNVVGLAPYRLLGFDTSTLANKCGKILFLFVIGVDPERSTSTDIVKPGIDDAL